MSASMDLESSSSSESSEFAKSPEDTEQQCAFLQLVKDVVFNTGLDILDKVSRICLMVKATVSLEEATRQYASPECGEACDVFDMWDLMDYDDRNIAHGMLCLYLNLEDIFEDERGPEFSTFTFVAVLTYNFMFTFVDFEDVIYPHCTVSFRRKLAHEVYILGEKGKLGRSDIHVVQPSSWAPLRFFFQLNAALDTIRIYSDSRMYAPENECEEKTRLIMEISFL